MRVQIDSGAIKLWASAQDTEDWANRPGERWPCSELAGRRFFAEFDDGGLFALSVDGGRGDQDIPEGEFNACCADLLRDRVPRDHAAWYVAVGQFIGDDGSGDR